MPDDPLPEQTDNRPRPEDGEQDVEQDPAVAYVEGPAIEAEDEQ